MFVLVPIIFLVMLFLNELLPIFDQKTKVFINFASPTSNQHLTSHHQKVVGGHGALIFHQILNYFHAFLVIAVLCKNIFPSVNSQSKTSLATTVHFWHCNSLSFSLAHLFGRPSVFRPPCTEEYVLWRAQHVLLVSLLLWAISIVC